MTTMHIILTIIDELKRREPLLFVQNNYPYYRLICGKADIVYFRGEHVIHVRYGYIIEAMKTTFDEVVIPFDDPDCINKIITHIRYLNNIESEH